MGAEVVGLQILPSALSIVWIVLVLPAYVLLFPFGCCFRLIISSTFSEPIGLQLRAAEGNIYLHAQIFTGVMYIGGAACMWFLRAWKIRELQETVVSRERRELELQDNDAVPREQDDLARHTSRGSVMLAANGLWSWQRV